MDKIAQQVKKDTQIINALKTVKASIVKQQQQVVAKIQENSDRSPYLTKQAKSLNAAKYEINSVLAHLKSAVQEDTKDLVFVVARQEPVKNKKASPAHAYIPGSKLNSAELAQLKNDVERGGWYLIKTDVTHNNPDGTPFQSLIMRSWEEDGEGEYSVSEWEHGQYSRSYVRYHNTQIFDNQEDAERYYASELRMQRKMSDWEPPSSKGASVRSKNKAAITGWDQKHVSDNYRITLGRFSIYLEEFPTKGMRQVRKFTISLWQKSSMDLQWWLPANIADPVIEMKPATYEQAKHALVEQADKLWEEVVEAASNPDVPMNYNPTLSLDKPHYGVYEEQVSTRKFVPEGTTEAIKAKGMDFVLESKYNSFSVYDPTSDFQQAEPYYMGYVEQSTQAAQKLYKTLQQNPQAVSKLSYRDLSKWFDAKGIRHKRISSSW